MLTALRLSDQKKVLARDSEKAHSPFACPSCQCEVVLHKGNIRAHHFKHKPPITCARGKGETAQHLTAKIEIHDALALQQNVTELELEKDFGTSIADVYARISGVPVAIEIQRSKVSVAEITERTKNYRRLGIAVIWIGLPDSNLSLNRYSPCAWEKWCHAAYFGRVYYWIAGQTLRPVHFAPYSTYIEPKSWYDSSGNEQYAGGYDKFSKRHKTPIHGVPVLLSAHFQPKHKSYFNSGSVVVPECLIYGDRQPKWW